MPTANEIQKERIKEIEDKADNLVKKCDTITVASINEKGYPRICAVTKLSDNGFSDIYFVTGKRSEYNGKATHFEKCSKASVCCFTNRDSLTLIGEVDFITDKETQARFWNEADRRFFSKGTDDPKFRLIHFHTKEATFWIEGKFRTCKYK
ncbi:MAG: pyridoxamine 5'-phosphate oxidase family protein [Clostridia bacterium]|nr:pyridoxamine 5'-phosphate oxidase family protein [Clostridia bacterium]